MFNLFPQLIIFFAVVAIIVIIVRRLPKLSEVKAEEKKSEFKKKATNLFEKFINFCKKFLSAFKNFSVSIFKKLYLRAQEIKEKKEKAPQMEKEVKELVTTASPTEKLKITTQDEIIDLLQKAAKFFGSGRFSDCEKIYIEVIKKDPKNLHAYKGLGKLYLKQGNLTDAKASFEEALKLKPGDFEAREKLKETENKIPPR